MTEVVATTETLVADVIASLEAELRDLETRGGRVRDTIESLRKIWNISTLTPPAPAATVQQASPPVPSRPKKPEPAAAAPKAEFETFQRGKRSPAGDQQAQMTRVLKAAATIPQPFRAAQLHLKVSDIRRETLKGYLAAFVQAKALVKTGFRAGTKYVVASGVDVSRLPTVPEPPPIPTPAPPAARHSTSKMSDKDLAVALMSMLASGASYEVRDLMKGLRGLDADLQADRVGAALEQLAQARRVERIGVAGSAPRYRKRAA